MVTIATGGVAYAQKKPPEVVADKPDGGAAAPKPADKTADKTAEGLAAASRKAAGTTPLLIAIVGDAVELRSADGAFKTPLARGPVASAVYDASLELVWVRRLGQLEVWDLRQEKPKAIPILADAADEGTFDIQRGDHHVGPGGMCIVPGTMTVHWSKRPTVEILGFDEMDSPPHPRLVGAAWLAKEFARKSRAVPSAKAPLPGPASKESRVPIPRTVGRCSTPDDCGSSVPFGSTGWTLVVGKEDPGADCQHYRCLLFNPATKSFGKPPMPTDWKPAAQKSMLGDCGLYRFDATGKWFAIDDQVCAVGGTCSTLGKSAQVVGWLDGENDVGTDN
jgi:hypothetical protein